MTPAVQQLLDSFDALPAAARHRAAVGILRRVSASAEAADELFRALDAEEAGNASR
ncbi:MAG TPA: hypothetical protein VG013_03965 [Gemmataceae bacterium]|jgi:hypothetical protein|nr:hypothetical protein [Gemmataceae bacterium]